MGVVYSLFYGKSPSIIELVDINILNSYIIKNKVKNLVWYNNPLLENNIREIEEIF